MYLNDLAGARFGKLTVRSPAGSRGGHMYWNCICDCGNEKTVRGSHLKYGNVRSCGCLPAHKTHGERRTRLYGVWANMMRRCYTTTSTDYQMYGARGITVCDEWHNFSKFAEWAKATGYDQAAEKGACTIERTDNNGPYCPINCKWADAVTQANNTRKTRKITYKGETHSVSEWARILNIKQSTLSMRINKYGWSVEDALGKEVKNNGS